MSHFVHLHLHTQYSILDGAIKIPELLKKAKEYGHKAVAMTDHGSMHGVIDFYQSSVAQGIKPIIGCELYVTSGSRTARIPVNQGGQPTFHATMLAQNNEGYRNLCRLVTLAWTEGFYHKPRVDFDILQKYSDGLICLSGCMAGEFAVSARSEDLQKGREVIEKYLRIFKDRFYLEVQPHQIKEQQLNNRFAQLLGHEIGVPIVATNDCHYLSADDKHAQEVLVCISTGKLITDENRLHHSDAKLHFKSSEEMISELPEFEEAVWQSGAIADQCDVKFEFGKYYMPKFTPKDGETLEYLFEENARKGLEARLTKFESINGTLSESKRNIYQQRLENEIQLIIQMGFAGYFLVVSDFITWSKSNDIPVGPGRGSAAGSLVAYALFITEVDPLEHNLLFERFLNPERISLPDIDIDFCIYGRDKVIEYVCDKYGRDKVAQIVTFGTLKAKAAIKDVGRVLGFSYAETDRIAKLIPPPRQGFDYPLAEALKMEKKLKDYAEGEGKELIGLAQKLEGMSRHTSTHAAGLVIADRPIVEFMPLMVDKESQVITQFSMNWVEKIGLVKFDFLGLKTLSVIHEALRLIRATTGKEVDINALKLNDAKTFRLISSGKTIGIFQLESSGITEMVSRMKPSCFEDIVAILALYRPGPLDAGMVDHYINRKHKREPVQYAHQILKPILSDTYGIILYQEQIMQIARDMAGYTLGQADMLRRAMGKKKPEVMAKQREIFINGTCNKGISKTVAEEVFDQMETFARYGFNRSHSVAYALISYQTAYLKTHYPKQFLAALMTFEMGDTDKTLKNIGECGRMKIPVMPPDVNKGDSRFNVFGKEIVFSLAAIKGIGEKAVEKIISERNENGPFKDMCDFCSRVDPSVLNRKTMESLIKSGAFDWTKVTRAVLYKNMEEVISVCQKRIGQKNSSQMSLFGEEELSDKEFFSDLKKNMLEWPINVKLSHEREALGFYLSGHPLEKFKQDLARFSCVSVSDVSSYSDTSTVTVAGVISVLKLKNTKKGDRYATFVLEDLGGTIEVIVWPDVYQKVYDILNSEDPVLVSGRLDVSEERRILIANGIESAILLRDRSAKEALIRLSSSVCSADKLERLKDLLATNQGNCAVKLVVRKSKHSEVVLALSDELKVMPSEDLCNQVEQLFGQPVMSFR